MGAMYLELSFDLGSLDPQAAEEAAFACGACAVTFVDARDDAVPEAAQVTETYAACFDVARFGDRDGWVCLAGRRR